MVSLATFNGLSQLPSLESLGLLKRDTSSLPKKMFECTPISSKVTLVKQPMHDVVRYSNVANQGSVRSTAPGLKRERPPSQTKVKLAKTGKFTKKSVSRTTVQPYCHVCGTHSTPEWRKGPDGPATLCNACGIKYSKVITEQKESVRERKVSNVNDEHVKLSTLLVRKDTKSHRYNTRSSVKESK